MQYLTWKGDHFQMGLERGMLLKRNGVTFPLRLDRFQLEHGKRSEAILRHFFPEVCAEIRGVSDATGTDYDALVSWLLCMGCCMYNLEDNLPAEIRGCTAFACRNGGRTLYGRNNDLPPCLKQASKSELYLPSGGARFCMTTSSFINGEEGLNEYGVAAAMTFVLTNPEQLRPGLNACFVVRYLLERAVSTKCALDLLMELPIAGNCNLLLADAGGEMVVIECTPCVKRVRSPISLPGGQVVCAVNRFLDETSGCGCVSDARDFYSAKRYRTVIERFSAPLQGDETEAVMRLLKGDNGFLCQYDDIPDFETVWSSVFDLNSLAIYRAHGDPRTAPFVADNRLRSVIRGV